MQIFIFSLLFLQIILTNAYNGYYWRDFHKKIPPDALPGGKDINGKQTYIGQTYIHNVGVFVIQIFPGEDNLLIDTVAYGVKKPSRYIKILCSQHHDRFYWMQTTSKTFQIDTTEKHAVIGGFDHLDANKGVTHVGRLTYQGGIRIGHIGSYALENALFMFLGGRTEQKATSYEVLIYKTEDDDAVTLFSNTSMCYY